MKRGSLQQLGSKLRSSIAETLLSSRKTSPARLQRQKNDKTTPPLTSIEISKSPILESSQYDSSYYSDDSSKWRKKRKSKKKRHYSSSSYSSTDSEETLSILSRRELFDLKTRVLRKRCHDAGLDVRKVFKKKDLVHLIYNHYNSKYDKESNYNTRGWPGMKENDEIEQMMTVLREILPFYGEGDIASDNTVTETIQRLPSYALDRRDNYGNTMLLLACQYGAYGLVNIMIAKGCDINAQNYVGVCCLHHACYTDSISPHTIQVLVENGANAEIKEKEFGCTPLHWVAFTGSIDLCGLLCSAGALPTTLDNNGCDPIQYATQANKLDCVQYLISVKESLSATKNQINEPLSPGWKKLIDEKSGLIYFHNFKTGVSMWEEDFVNRNKHSRHFVHNQVDGVNKNITMDQVHELSSTPPKVHKSDSNSNSVGKNIVVHGERDRIITETEIAQFDLDLSQDSIDSPQKNKENVLRGEKVKSNDNISQSISTTSLPEHLKTRKAPSKVIIPSKSQMLSPMIFSPCEALQQNAKKATSPGISKETFEERLAALQCKMEKQLIDQLKNIESKINLPVKNIPKSPAISLEAQKSLSSMGAKIIQLQTDIGTKDMEIIALKRDIVSMEEKFRNNLASNEPKKNSRDFIMGDCDVTEEWIPVSNANHMQKEFEAKTHELDTTKRENRDIKSNQNKLERQISILTEECEILKDKSESNERALTLEKKAKDELITLLQQTREGIEVESQMAQSIAHEKEKNNELISSLKEKIESNNRKANVEKHKLFDQIDEYKNQILDQRAKVEILNAQNQEQQLLLTTEKSKVASMQAKLEDLQILHEKENLKLKEDYERKTNDDNKAMLDAHNLQLDSLNNMLNEEKLACVQKELEKNEAEQAMHSAVEKAKETEVKLQEMKKMITDAKKMVRANEQLHAALHIETDRRKALHNKIEDLKGKIRVYVRIRPMNADEKKKDSKIALIKEDERTCVMCGDVESNHDSKAWEFDQIFSGESGKNNSQENIFKDTKRLITSAVDGFNVCIFAYGQTGSGKTYTMFGAGGNFSGMERDEGIFENTGLAPRSAAQLFKVLQEREASNEIKVKVTMFELYNDALRDLLVDSGKSHGQPLKIKLAEHSSTGMVEVEGAKVEQVHSLKQMLTLFQKGARSRTTSSTQMNADSSRSHLITSIMMSLTNKRTGKAVYGKLTLVDLAGSEKVGKSGAKGQQLKEAQSINKSLSALGDVISSLTSGNKHIPYRNHALTMLMSDSIGGSAKTLMFVCCSPSDYNRSESSNSLDFAKRCKNITNDINRKGSHISQVRALKLELARMKKEKGVSNKKKLGIVRRPGM